MRIASIILFLLISINSFCQWQQIEGPVTNISISDIVSCDSALILVTFSKVPNFGKVKKASRKHESTEYLFCGRFGKCEETNKLGAILTKDSAAILLIKESIFVLISKLKTWI